ncbi:MAG TPA: hypothetical protein VNC39_08560, partial [Acidocella sp.]|uniref:hypothetical protein n=1 Tax=Acidocella sp. TaxID=50710 RepID=UPI002BEF7146
KWPLFEKSGAKTFIYAGPWAVSATTPIAQSKQSFFATFCSQKVAFLTYVFAALPRRRNMGVYAQE